MAKFEWSEVFMSIEGEAKYAGWPTAYIRFARCNFQCKGFNNPTNVDTTSIETLGFDPKDYKDIYSIPLIHKGCDSIYSWDEKFAHMWNIGNEHELGDALTKILPHKSFVNPSNGKRVILSLTGGEPTLRLKFFPHLLQSPAFSECNHILIETNCAVPVKQKMFDELARVCAERENRIRITWSNSPKLSLSGEKWAEAIRPEIALLQNTVFKPGNGIEGEQYFKFVCDDSDASFDEVATVMSEYYNAGIPRTTEVYIMPVACTEEQQQQIAARVAKRCMQEGYIYCHRIQNSVFGNGVGT